MSLQNKKKVATYETISNFSETQLDKTFLPRFNFRKSSRSAYKVVFIVTLLD